MNRSMLSALKGGIGYTQLKLFHFFSGDPDVDKILTKRFIQSDQQHKIAIEPLACNGRSWRTRIHRRLNRPGG